jgi:MFS family permease
MYGWHALAYNLLTAAGRWMQAGGIFLSVAGRSFRVCLAAAVLLGLGTALVYPTLLAAVSDVAHPDWGASAVGALTAGVIADALGILAASAVIGALTLLSFPFRYRCGRRDVRNVASQARCRAD